MAIIHCGFQANSKSFRAFTRFGSYFGKSFGFFSAIKHTRAIYYAMHTKEYEEEFNSELLYIGQSYGKYGEKDSTSRLKNHSTLQKIYSE